MCQHYRRLKHKISIRDIEIKKKKKKKNRETLHNTMDCTSFYFTKNYLNYLNINAVIQIYEISNKNCKLVILTT